MLVGYQSALRLWTHGAVALVGVAFLRLKLDSAVAYGELSLQHLVHVAHDGISVANQHILNRDVAAKGSELGRECPNMEVMGGPVHREC